MTLKEYMELVERFDEMCNETLVVANKEYAHEDSKFSNFDVTAQILRAISPRLAHIEPQDIAIVMIVKHLLSIGGEVSLRESMEGRYKDLVNYVKLHYGMYMERQFGAKLERMLKDTEEL